ncbi:MAG: polyprenyl synthetase family protein, partial [Chloroflexota bacterium]
MEPRFLSNELLSNIERALKETVAIHLPADYPDFIEMITYHMGWTGNWAGPQTKGKRIRPLLLLLSTGACGGNWHTALPAAAAVEILHNYTLIHDD